MKTRKIAAWILIIFGGLFVSMALDQYVFNLNIERTGWFFHVVNAIGLILLLIIFTMINKIGLFISTHGKNDNIAQFTIDKLITNGLYAKMLHPIYQWILFVPFSVSLMSFSPSFIFIIAPIEVLIILLIIKYIDEPAARKKFGKEYDKYAKDKPRFCFKPSCLKLFKEVFYTKPKPFDYE